MSNHSKTVLWLGLIMIVLNLVKNWAQIRDLIFKGGGSSGGSGGGLPLIPIPFPPFLVGKHHQTPSNVKAV